MCDICLQTPCDPRCPNAPENPIVYVCESCGHEIREGESVYFIYNDPWCKDCIDGAHEYAELEE